MAGPLRPPVGDMPPEEFRRLAHQVADWIADYLAGVGDLPVLAQVSPGDVRSALPESAPETGEALDAALADSSARLGVWLAAPGPSPAQDADRHEQAVVLATALAELPEAEREAVVLQHWHGLTVAAIGDRLGRTPAAVGGLLKRGLRRLRERLADEAAKRQIQLFLPSPALCTDNGAMVAAAAAHRFERGEFTDWASEVDSSMKL